MPEWYESFFSELAVDFWRAAVPPEAARNEADFIARELRVAPGAKLLDLPCGAGRHVRELNSRGYDVTGVDISAAATGGTKLLRGDMRDPAPGGPYDGVYCFGNSFGYLTAADTLKFMRNVRDALKAGGRFALETHLVAESVLPYTPVDRSLDAGGVTFHIFGRYDEAKREIVQDATLRRGATVQRSQIIYRVFTLQQVRSMLADAGLRVEATYGDLAGRPFVPGDRRLLLIAQKP
ncbi:MAG: methyltransferase domain-containing protein [Myxococcaceae bacterium]|nr:methyltransferase domain-containing protein [Myxococcaceae bacterium]